MSELSAGVPPAAAAQPAPAPKKPTKLMADLAAAIRATTEAARDQRLSQLDSEATGIVEMIRAQSDEGAVALRRQSDEDVAAIREWAKAEIARIKDSCEAKIADRKHVLEQEVADHAAAIEDRVAEVQSETDRAARSQPAVHRFGVRRFDRVDLDALPSADARVRVPRPHGHRLQPGARHTVSVHRPDP